MKLTSFCSDKEFTANVYVLSDKDEVLLIDPGYYDEKIVAEILSGGTLKGILLTHGHFDHIRGLDDYLKLFAVPVYIYKTEKTLLENSRYNCSTLMTGEDYSFHGNLSLLEQDSYSVGSFTFDVILTDGHTPGSCSYYFKDYNIIFVGDFLIGYSIGRVDLPGGSKVAMEKSLQKFKNLNLPKDTIVYSGHEAGHKYGILIKKNPFFN